MRCCDEGRDVAGTERAQRWARDVFVAPGERIVLFLELQRGSYVTAWIGFPPSTRWRHLLLTHHWNSPCQNSLSVVFSHGALENADAMAASMTSRAFPASLYALQSRCHQPQLGTGAELQWEIAGVRLSSNVSLLICREHPDRSFWT